MTMLTGAFDDTSAEDSGELQDTCRSLGAILVTVEACHIVSKATMQGIGTAGGVKNKVHAVASFHHQFPPHPLLRRTMLPVFWPYCGYLDSTIFP